MDLDALRIFAKVAEQASFTRASEQLGLAKARVSAGVRQLETELGTRLFQRTTRTVRITPDGELLLERSRALLDDADEVLALFQSSPSALRGRLRVDLPNIMARNVVIPRLPEFLAAHPLLEFELSTTDRRVDLVQEGIDCVVRVGALPDSGLVARPLGLLRQVNVASPAYLQRFGLPRTLEDLDHHHLIHYAPTFGATPLGWEYQDRDGKGRRFRPMRGAVSVNSTDAYQAACLAGLGLIQAPELGLRALMAEGRLVAVLSDFVAEPMPVSLLYPHRAHLPKRVQAVMDWLAEVLRDYLEAG